MALVKLNPTMTGYNTPAPFAVSASSERDTSSYAAWRAFDNNNSLVWCTAQGVTSASLTIDLNVGRKAVSYTIKADIQSSELDRNPATWTLEGSNDNFTTKDILDTQTNIIWTAASEIKTFSVATPGTYRYYRLNMTNGGDVYYLIVQQWDLYEENGVNGSYIALIPPMTSNTAPAPFVASSSSQYSASYYAFKAFDKDASTYWQTALGVVYPVNLAVDLGIAQSILAYSITSNPNETNRNPKDWTLEGSNDNTAWTVLDTQSNVIWISSSETKTFPCDSGTNYRYYRLNITANNGNTTYKAAISEFQLLGDTTPSTGAYLYSTGAVQPNPDAADLYLYSTGAVKPNPDVADLYLYSNTQDDPAYNKNIAMITNDPTNLGATNAKALLESQGHTVTVFTDTTVTTTTDFNNFDIIAIVRASYNGTWQNRVIEYMQNGKPIIIGGVEQGASIGATDLSFAVNAKLASQVYLTNNSTDIVPIKSHPIINGFPNPTTVYPSGTFFGTVYTYNLLPAVGDILAQTSGLSNRYGLVAYEKGIARLDGTVLGARAVYIGFLYGQNGFTEQGKQIIENAIQWATVPMPTISKINRRHVLFI